MHESASVIYVDDAAGCKQQDTAHHRTYESTILEPFTWNEFPHSRNTLRHIVIHTNRVAVYHLEIIKYRYFNQQLKVHSEHLMWYFMQLIR